MPADRIPVVSLDPVDPVERAARAAALSAVAARFDADGRPEAAVILRARARELQAYMPVLGGGFPVRHVPVLPPIDRPIPFLDDHLDDEPAPDRPRVWRGASVLLVVALLVTAVAVAAWWA